MRATRDDATVRDLRSENARLSRRLTIAEGLIDGLKRENRRLLRLAHLDDLTVLGNRRHFRESYASIAGSAMRNGDRISLLLIDVDRFKHFNDAYGHGAGDEVLIELAGILRSVISDHDLLARYGGEEFSVLLPSAGEEESRMIAERIRYTVESHPWPLRGVTVSIGVATISGDGLVPVELIEAADKALYLSKEAGRNLVHHSGDLTESMAPC